MTILIFFAVILVAIILAIFLNRLVKCPWLIGLIFFSIALLVAIILSNLNLVILAIIVGAVGFIAAFFDCVIKSSCFFRDNKCLTCYNPYEVLSSNDNINNGNSNNNSNDTLAIVNSNGDVIARIRGNSINCYDEQDTGCGCNREDSTLLNENNNSSTINSTYYGCSRRYRRWKNKKISNSTWQKW